MRPSFHLLSSLILILLPSPVIAASCCGGSFAAPAILTGDERAQVTASVSCGEVVVDNVNSRGVWYRPENPTSIRSLTVDMAHLISDRWQMGASLPLTQRTRANESASGVGDFSVDLAYEAVPEWSFHPIRPKVFTYLKSTIPMGKPRAESERGGLDSFGSGFWSFAFGGLATKRLRRFDVHCGAEIRRSLSSQFSSSFAEGELHPGWGGNASIGAGISSGANRFGALLTWHYEDAIKIRAFRNETSGGVERFASAALSVSRLLDSQWAASLSYDDQTWFGRPLNTSLARSLAFRLQRRWPR